MQTQNIYQPYEISFQQLDESPVFTHQHHFFELVYISSGTGRQIINDHQFNYNAGNMFLITPEDSHSFSVTTTTQFFFVRFNDIYIKLKKEQAGSETDRIKRLEYILLNTSHQAGCILCNPADKLLVKALVQSMSSELINQQVYHREMIDQLVNTLITIVARNIAISLPDRLCSHVENAVMDFINYIQENIHTPELLKASRISEKFGISEGYLGRYFKKHTGENMQQYIINYKLKLIETRLKHSDMRINEIVSEFGFTDESHLNRIFKKHKGLNPSAFRKLNLAQRN